MTENQTSEGTLLGGRVAYRQLRHGHRSGFEPVLMAALVPARQNQTVLEIGTGAGAALLCLTARIPTTRGIGVERDPSLASLAAQNFASNGFAHLGAVVGDAVHLPFSAQSFQHVMANPPWFSVGGTRGKDELRAQARHAIPMTLGLWITEMLRVLRDKGSITLALPAASYAEAVSCLRPLCGAITLLPLWSRRGEKTKVILLQAQKASHAPDSILPGLILHDENGITPEAEAILRGGQPLTTGEEALFYGPDSAGKHGKSKQ